jgi:hypothetical protein
VKNIGLDDTATGVQTGTVNEPTAAAFLDELFVTGNWFASHSSDGGSSWTLVDPFTSFPPAAGGFCCDQITLHERGRNLWIWILQYVRNGGSNVFRVAVSTSGAPGPWVFWDFSPVELDPAWANNWFDYPDAAVSNNHLYLTFNVFDNATPQEHFVSSAAFKMPLDGLVNQNLTYQYYKIATHGSLRLTRGASSDMFFASHRGQNPVTVFHWPDDPSSSMSTFEVSASAWSGAQPYSSQGPGGVEWLSRLDPRITGAWVVGAQAGFLWSANAGPGRPQPYVKGLIVDTNSQALVSEPDIWNETFSFAYPAACPNRDGQVGASVFFGGAGQLHPNHVVGFLDGGQWVLAITQASTHGPADTKWGDYLSCRVQDPDAAEWVASGYTLQGGTGREFIEPRYVHFGTGP